MEELVDGEDDPRGGARSNVFLTAVIAMVDEQLPVRIRNVSARGALLEAANLPNEGAPIELRRGHLRVQGKVVWRVGHQCGVRFTADIDVPAWVKRVGHSGQERVDRTMASLLRQQEPPFEMDRGPGREQLPTLIEAIEGVCERLAGSPALSTEVAEEVLRLNAIVEALKRISG